jgi:peptidoglycan/xylan/chitin deacetylase (PgdA/CDA1 family)
MLKSILSVFSRAFSAKTLLRAGNPSLVAPFYHLVSMETPLHVKHLYTAVTPKQFEADIDFILKHFTPIGVESIHLINQSERPAKPYAFLSFDDGFREMITVVAPILLSKGVPATFFVNPAFVDNKDMLYRCKLSLIAEKANVLGNSFFVPDFLIKEWGANARSKTGFLKNLFKLKYSDGEKINQIANAYDVDLANYLAINRPYLSMYELKQLEQMGFGIGAHSHNHPNFADISLEQQIAEVENSVNWVQTHFPNQQKTFAFPFSNAGVNPALYNHFFNENSSSIYAMFGTSGLKPVDGFALYHRIPMEVKGKSAEQILKSEFLYYIAKKIFGMHAAKLPV